MANHFNAVGFNLQSRDEIKGLVQQTAQKGDWHMSSNGHAVCWSVGGGVEFWVQTDSQRSGKSLSPHFYGTSRVRAGVVRTIVDEEHLQGRIYAWFNPPDDDPASGQSPFVFDVPNFDMVRERLRLPFIATVQLAAFAHEMTCFADEAEFDESQQGTPRFAPTFFIPSGLFTGDSPEPPRAMALFAGHVERSELRTNPASGHPFHCLSVQTMGGVLDVVADPAIVEKEPAAGGIVRGSFWLSGRIVDDLATP